MAAKILVTGAGGFVGQALCRRLITLGHAVTALTREAQDITKPFSLKAEFDFVFHLAAHNITHVGDTGADLYHLVNVEGTRNVLKAVAAKHFVLLSTAKIYLAQGKPITEDSPLLPLKEYEKSKLAAENVCADLVNSKSLLIFRAVNIVGKGQPDKAVIPVLFKKAAAGEPMEIFGPKDSVLQLLYVEDVVDAFVKVVEKGGLAGIYNLASPAKMTLGELAVAIKEICQSKSDIRFVNHDKATFSEVLSTKVEKELGWKARTTVREILEEYCNLEE